MKCYIVGGYVRDQWIARLRPEPEAQALRPEDRDWVVVGASAQEMLDAGFTPVGQDFPVFLHPKTHEEYALARTERKNGHGYKGFVFFADPSVTLEEDLKRRDLTINAIAQDEAGETVDPFGGLDDIRAGVLRHVSDAFLEDPVRLLRCARFAARFPYFRVADETMALMRQMVASGETDALTPERVYQEWKKGMASAHPERMIEVLQETGYWARHAPKIPLTSERVAAIVAAAQADFPVHARLALLACAAGSPEAAESFLRHLKADAVTIEFAKLYSAQGEKLTPETSLDELLDILAKVDAVRRPERAELLFKLRACVLGIEPDRWLKALSLWRDVDVAALARSVEPKTIGTAVLAARRRRVTEGLD